ncbi:MAG TPA: hypothetical protein VJ820_09440 [Propionibacteriaceae bacterium]|nr:hypothetical protein [Propionibacteriaceae bacterium]
MRGARRGIGSVLLFVLACAVPAAASPETRERTRQGYAHAYDLRFVEALSVLNAAHRADPKDPAPPLAVAAITWMEILFAQGVATFEAFSGHARGESVPRPAAPAVLRERFLTHVERAIAASEAYVARQPGNLDAEYQKAASIGLLALYRSTVEGRTVAGFREGRRAVAAMERIQAANPDHRESGLIPGIYRYAVSTLPFHLRLVAAIGGVGGDRQGGLKLLEQAAEEGAETATDASLVLMVIYNREGRPQDALRHLARLQRRHPANRLLQLNTAATALAAGQPALAEREATPGLQAVLAAEAPYVAGELGLWLYTRAAARAAMGHPETSADLEDCFQSNPREWVRARAHLLKGRLALRASHYHAARSHFQAAGEYGRQAGDEVSIKEATHELSKVRTGQPGNAR